MPSFSERVKAFINPSAVAKSAGANWFLNFLKLANDEDTGDTVTLTDAYSKVAWLNIAVSTRARNIARADFQLMNGDTEIEDGPVYELFNHDMGGRSRYQLWEETEGWRCLRGEAIWILSWGGVKGFPQQIVMVDPLDMTHKVDPGTRKITQWVYKSNRVGEGSLTVPFRPEEVVHFPMWDPADPYRGVNQVGVIAQEVAQERQSAVSGTRLLINNAIPGGVISIPGDTLNTQEAEVVIENWEKKHRGSKNAGRVAVIGGGATYQRVSMTPQEMQSFEGRSWNRDTILAKFGVPHASVGVAKTGGTLAGKDTMEQMRSFWNLTLLPELHYFEDKLEHDFFERFHLNMTGEFSTEHIDELQADQETLHARLRSDTQTGLLTINEAREILGMDPVEWGSIWWVPINLTPATAEPAGNPPPAPIPPPEQASFFPETKTKVYTAEYRQKHWEMVIKKWEQLEQGYTKAVKSWIFEIRQQHLHTLMENGFTQAIQHSTADELSGEPLWNTYWNKLKDVSRPWLTRAVDSAGEDLNSIFTDLGILGGRSFSIWDTRAVGMLEYRLNQGSLKEIPQTIRSELQSRLGDGIRYGWTETEMADSIRGLYNIVSNRAPTIARTEVGGAINDSRQAGFIAEGFKQIEWLSAQDEKVRPTHQIDGETIEIGQQFSNGLVYPNDPNGPPEEVINCRCLALPVFDGEAVQQTTHAPIGKTVVEEMSQLLLATVQPIQKKMLALEARNVELTAELAKRPEPTINVTTPPVTVHIDNTSKKGKKIISMVKGADGELESAEVEEVDGD